MFEHMLNKRGGLGTVNILVKYIRGHFVTVLNYSLEFVADSNSLIKAYFTHSNERIPSSAMFGRN